MLTRTWTVINLEAGERPTNAMLEGVLHCFVPAIVIPKVIPKGDCEAITERLEAMQPTSYEGIDLAWALPEDKQGPGHWEIKYQGRDWLDNINARPKIDAAIAEVFGDLGHPREIVERILGAWEHGPVGSLIHPIYAKPVIAGQLRRGAPDAHVDDLNFDASIASTHGQIGINVVMNNPEHGDLELFNVLWNRPGTIEGAPGTAPVGNYGIPPSEFEHAPSVTIPCEAGSVVIVSNRLVHRVQRVPTPRQRLAFALHAAWLFDGQLALFS